MQEIQTHRFYIYSSAYAFQVPVRVEYWDKLSWEDQMLYYAALKDLNATGWTVPGFSGNRPKVTAAVHRRKIIGFTYIVTDGYRKAFILAVLHPLETLKIDERLEGSPS